MIEIASPLEIKIDNSGGGEIIFWIGNSPNWRAPFRNMLDEIAAVLSRHSQVDLKTPPYESGEDFIEGTLQFGDALLRVYFEYSLAYLSLGSEDAAALREAAGLVQSNIVVSA